MGATISYSLGKITNGEVAACNGASLPTPPQQVNFFTVTQRSSLSAPFSASADAEYNHPISDEIDSFLRGQVTYKGASRNDPTNPYDDVDSYGLANLYAGVRAADGVWEVAVYAKNIFDTFRVPTRGATPNITPYATFTGGGAIVTNYRTVTVTQPREFGLTARFVFGSR